MNCWIDCALNVAMAQHKRRHKPIAYCNLTDLVTVSTYLGEGSFAVWVKGAYRKDFSLPYARQPNGKGCTGDDCTATQLDMGKKEWWAKIRLKSGQTGWVNMDSATADFDGVDLLS
jgi:hypothetical protein